MIETSIKQLKVVFKPMKPPVLCVQLPQNEVLNEFAKLEDKSLDGYVLTVKKPKKKSLSANNYMWQLCDKIAYKIKSTKEDVYRHAVREVGAWFDTSCDADKADELCKTWETNGVGWFAEPILMGQRIASIRLYKGSSVYDSIEMSRLVDYIVEEAKGLGIETMTPDQILQLEQMWNGGNDE
jgi:hypothetical protein